MRQYIFFVFAVLMCFAQPASALSIQANSTGPLTATFFSTDAGYELELGVLINGVDAGVTGLRNHSSSKGDSFSFGNVTAGDSLIFYLKDLTNSINKSFTSPSLNPEGKVYVLDSLFAGDSLVPAGLKLSFEDSLDFDFNDMVVVVSSASAVPLPAALPLLVSGLGALGIAGWRRTRRLSLRSRSYTLRYR